ncbi:MAG: hypothetical protein WDN31_23155 [Hyphomicrobium sp.]
MGTYLDYGLFLTRQMASRQRFPGVAPLLMIAIVRGGGTIFAVEPVHIDEAGEVREGEAKDLVDGAGVRILFSDAHGRSKKLLYFKANLANTHLDGAPFLHFLGSLMPADTSSRVPPTFCGRKPSPVSGRRCWR